MLQEATAKMRLEFPFDKVRQRMVHLLAPLPHLGPVAGDAGVQHGFLRATAAVGTTCKAGGRHEKQVTIRSMLSRSACTTCPAGLTGTLVAIEGILKAEVDPEIVVITV